MPKSKGMEESRWKREIRKLQEWIDIMRGKTPIKHRLAPLTTPEEIRTATILTPSQVSFVANSYWLGDTYPPLFGGLKRYSKSLMYPAISKRGIGREQQIEFMQALTEVKTLKKLGVTVGGKGDTKE